MAGIESGFAVVNLRSSLAVSLNRMVMFYCWIKICIVI
jgi:hypothetical protein